MESVGEIIRKQNSHKELKHFLYNRWILHRNVYELIEWKWFEHTTIRVPHIFHIWVVKFVSGFCGTNGMRYKWKEVPNPGCTCWNQTEVNIQRCTNFTVPCYQGYGYLRIAWNPYINGCRDKKQNQQYAQCFVGIS